MAESSQPTVVLVRGAFADASWFGGVIPELTASGYRVLAPANPLRGRLPRLSRWPVLRPGPILLPSSTRYAQSRFAAAPCHLTPRTGISETISAAAGWTCGRWAEPLSPGNVGAAPWSQVPGRGDARYSSGAGARN
jgi:hypothetical protein